MPTPSGNLVSLALETISNGIRSVWASDGDRLGNVPFPTEFHEDTTYTQKVGNSGVVTADTVIYTVPADTEFYLTTLEITAYNAHATTMKDVAVRLRDDTDVNVIGWRLLLKGATNDSIFLSFPIPIKVLTGYDIQIDVTDADVSCSIAFTGFEK